MADVITEGIGWHVRENEPDHLYAPLAGESQPLEAETVWTLSSEAQSESQSPPSPEPPFPPLLWGPPGQV